MIPDTSWEPIDLRSLANLWRMVLREHNIEATLGEKALPATGYTAINFHLFSAYYRQTNPHLTGTLHFNWDRLNHLRYQSTEDDFWAELGFSSIDFDADLWDKICEASAEPRLWLRIEFSLAYRTPSGLDLWYAGERTDELATSVSKPDNQPQPWDMKKLTRLCREMSSVISGPFPLTRVPVVNSPFNAIDTQIITNAPRIEATYIGEMDNENPIITNKISIDVLADIFLPRAWSGEVDFTDDLPPAGINSVVLGWIKREFNEVAGRIAMAMESLALIAQRESDEK